tara:strand:+ start:177 stop:422 length:246 start_codon:yes stop_codon:yes gene_type:complete
MTKIFLLLLLLLLLLLFIINKTQKIRLFKKVSKSILFMFILFSTLIFLIFLRLHNNNDIDGKYSPAKYDGKVLSPGSINND